jgi:hypothetical protein
MGLRHWIISLGLVSVAIPDPAISLLKRLLLFGRSIYVFFWQVDPGRICTVSPARSRLTVPLKFIWRTKHLRGTI